MMTLPRFLRIVSSSLFILLLFACAVAGQTETATISGLVTDRTAAAVSGAEVRLQSVERGTVTMTTTNDAGIYVFPSVQPGQYQISIQKQGFKQVDLLGLIVNVQDHIEQNFRLEVGSISESVTVEGGVSLINTESAAVSTVVDQTYIRNMPLNGRSFQSLILLTPGIVTNSPQQSSTVGGNGEFSVNGQRTESNYYTVDGVNANTGVFPGDTGPGNSGSVTSATALGSTQSLVSIDALQEFRIQTSTYSAEYGRNPGGQFSFVTRSGTNQWHGTAFNYLRNDYFDANNWFNNYFGQREPPLRQNDFGGTLGGPIDIPGLYNGKDKTFFFFSYEGLRLRQPQASTLNQVPDAYLRTCAPAPLQPVLNAFPQPSVSSPPPDCTNPDPGNGLAAFVGTWSNPSSLDAYGIRFDHSFGGKLGVFFRFSDTPSNATARLTGGGSTGGTPSVLQAFDYLSRTYTFGATSALSTRLNNEFRLNYSSNLSRLADSIDGFGGAQPVDLAKLQGISQSAYSVMVNFLFRATISQKNFSGLQKQWNILDSASASLGRHQLKFGIDWRRSAPVEAVGSPRLFYLFFTKGAAQTNSPNILSAQNNSTVYPLYTNFSAFVQDEWKITQRLNLSMGVRWEVNPPPSVTQGLLPYTVQGSANLGTLTLAPQGTPLWKTAWYNFAPRLGAAWVLGNAKGYETVVRGGGGLFFDTGQQLGSDGFLGPGFSAFKRLSGATAAFPISNAQIPVIVQPPAPPFGAVYVYPLRFQLPYTLEWNAAVEQALGASQTLSLAYVGSHAARLLEVSQVDVSSLNPSFSTVVFDRNGLTADYHALQVQFKRRLSHGLTALGAYTWGHAIDYGSYNAALPYQRASSDYDVRHNFSAAFSYDLPNALQSRIASVVLHHWGLDGRFTARTGFPVFLNGDPTINPATGQAVNGGLDLVSGQPFYLYGANCASVLQGLGDLAPGQGCPGNRAINPNAFTSPACDPNTGVCAVGTAPRNLVRGFGAWQMDIAVRRDFPIHERLKLQFRAEAFNAFNHPNFGQIDPNIFDPTFGQAISTLNGSLGTLNSLYQMGGPRSMQFALKLVY